MKTILRKALAWSARLALLMITLSVAFFIAMTLWMVFAKRDTGALFFLVLVGFIAIYFLANKKINLEKHGFNAYMKRHDLSGKTKCFKCGSTNIGTMNGRNNSDRRTHFCRNCGENLFFSAE
ncbi:hypothetical protein ICN48_06520 [Polynucleobacter sp. JS-Safj-400b-B2]|uniref:hypothetical protein n=1 Tax=Polynucleobacter sp. JS-Safj-400b-B2 TaxID=2576921 RepID=UPI001C0C1185|nr:hypothetical protein [Polynucleobacter sp. JS-Safj-400b-B2]MBU3625887.1 hypothetical protein [Polynucleobacter sp. JS-Safj-400b-B2]